MRKSWLGMLAAMLSVSALVGCRSGGSAAAEPEEPIATKPSIPIPANSPFAQIKLGMYQDEVFAKIGPPTTTGAYVTGKAWIPFHFSGSDTHRTIARYKGQGILTFANDSAYTSGMSLVSIDYDPNELGYEHSEPAK